MAGRSLPGGQIPIPPPPPPPGIPRHQTASVQAPLPAGVRVTHSNNQAAAQHNTPQRVVPQPIAHQTQAPQYTNMTLQGMDPRTRQPLVEVSDIRCDLHETEETIKEELSEYRVFRFVLNDFHYDDDEDDDYLGSNPTHRSLWENCTVTQTLDNKKNIQKEIRRLKDHKSVLERKNKLNISQRRQLERKLQHLAASDTDPRFHWELVQLDVDLKPYEPPKKEQRGRRSSNQRSTQAQRDPRLPPRQLYNKRGRPLMERAAITGYYKRSPQPNQLPSQVRHRQLQEQQQHTAEYQRRQQAETLRQQQALLQQQQDLRRQQQEAQQAARPPVSIVHEEPRDKRRAQSKTRRRPTRDHRKSRSRSRSRSRSHSRSSSESSYDSYSESDSGSDSTYPTSRSSASNNHRRRSRDHRQRQQRDSKRNVENPRDYGRRPPTRRHSRVVEESGYDTIGRGGGRVPLVPMAPRTAPNPIENIDAVARNSFTAGRAIAARETAERNFLEAQELDDAARELAKRNYPEAQEFEDARQQQYRPRLTQQQQQYHPRFTQQQQQQYFPRLTQRPAVHQERMPWQSRSDEELGDLSNGMSAMRFAAFRTVQARRREATAAEAREEELERRGREEERAAYERMPGSSGVQYYWL